jgi:hypothetical protein
MSALAFRGSKISKQEKISLLFLSLSAIYVKGFDLAVCLSLLNMVYRINTI